MKLSFNRLVNEGKHPASCSCGFCQNKGKIHLRGKSAKAGKDKDEAKDTEDEAKPTAESIVDHMLDRS